METVAAEVVEPLMANGFSRTRSGVLLRYTQQSDLDHWALATRDNGGISLSIGAISPKMNRFAFKIFREAAGPTFKTQFPAYAAPPIFIPISHDLRGADLTREIQPIIDDFTARFGDWKLDDWFRFAVELTPYGHAQTIVVPAYLYLKNDWGQLESYLVGAHDMPILEEFQSYFLKIEELMNAQLSDDGASL